MNIINNGLNILSRLLLGVGVFDVFEKASQSQKEYNKAETLAQTKQIFQSVKITRAILAKWSSSPSFFERLFRQWAMNNFLEELEKQEKKWVNIINEANKLARQAENLKRASGDNPFETKKLSQAIQVYQQCQQMIYNHLWIEATANLIQIHQDRQSFKSLMNQGKNLSNLYFFKEALKAFEEAKKLFPIKEVDEQISVCHRRTQEEERYETLLSRVNQIATEGRFQEALDLFKLTYAQFPRSDGKQFLERLHRVITAKEYYHFGLLAEQDQDWESAKVKYQEALQILPELRECHLRLAIVAIHKNCFTQALSYLQNIKGEQANYLRGYAYAKLRRWQPAKSEWKRVNHSQMETQCKIIDILSQHERQLMIKEIEQSIEQEKLKEAKNLSLDFITKYGLDPIVKSNLDAHIEPRLEAFAWTDSHWTQMAKITEQQWLNQQDITSLHNWAIANYYLALTDSTQLSDLIIAWSTALANINQDPTLQAVPWLGNNKVDFLEIFSHLTQVLESLIDNIKEQDMEKYLQMRDLFRREKMIWQEPQKGGIKIGKIYITSGCYQSHRKKFQNVRMPDVDKNSPFPYSLPEIFCTEWGLAIAACLEGDIVRAIHIKPSIPPNSRIENYADSFISYHEGRYYLQNKDWQKAVIPLKKVKKEIWGSQIKWEEEMERLCTQQRHAIENFQEHLNFAQFWYDLLGSSSARSYLAEYKVEQVREKVANQKISYSQAIKDLKEIQKIDRDNPMTLDLINNLEIIQELETIDNLMKRNEFEQAVRRAKSSQHHEVQLRIAEFLIDIIIEGVKSGRLPFDIIIQFGLWAKELCPYEPAFQDIYRSLRL